MKVTDKIKDNVVITWRVVALVLLTLLNGGVGLVIWEIVELKKEFKESYAFRIKQDGSNETIRATFLRLEDKDKELAQKDKELTEKIDAITLKYAGMSERLTGMEIWRNNFGK